MQNKDIIWKIGEKKAKEYLESRGYKIIGQNYRTKYSEIDLIAKKNSTLVFIEVRTKRNENFVSPEESINQKKLKKIFWNAEKYIGLNKYKGLSRIDAICIILDSNNKVKKLRHYKSIL